MTAARLSDEAVLRIRDMLMSGALSPGSRIREAPLAQDLGMSRTPVRDGLRRLEAEGLIREIPHQGYLVVEVSADELRDIYRVRSALEGLAAEQAAARLGRIDLARLEDLIDAMAAELDGDQARLAELNQQFHRTIAEASGNAFLISLLSDVDAVSQRFRRAAVGISTRRIDAQAQHQQLFDALRARDGDQARQIADEHTASALSTRLGADNADNT
jgi:DNA-binding GntR family transcriptional regulator